MICEASELAATYQAAITELSRVRREALEELAAQGMSQAQIAGMINLNRDNLVVVCGPRLSPLIAQVLASDYRLGFEQDESGWYLVDRVEEATYRSPMDHGESSDYAYFGRLPRLDGKGNFLYIAGIHAIGAVGVVHYLDNHLTELYREVKTRRFSTIIRCNFDAATRRIENSKRVSALYKTEGN